MSAAARWRMSAGLALAVVACAGGAVAAELDEVRRRGELVWAADQEGGGPHVFPAADDPRRLTGFEVELAGMIAERLGVKARFQQGAWDRLPLLLGGVADCVINGIESTPVRRRDYGCSRPYFAYALQIVARRDGALLTPEMLVAPGPRGPWQVGVLSASAAETEMRGRDPAAVFVRSFEGTLDSLEQVRGGVLDAAVLDDCIFTFYADRFPDLRMVGRPFNGGVYTVLTARDTPALGAAIDEALGTLVADGSLEALYDRWHLGGRQQMLLIRDSADVAPAAVPEFRDLLRRVVPTLLQGAGMTILLAVVSFPLAIVVGLMVAICRQYGPRWLDRTLSVYVEILRGTPLMLQLYAIFFLLPRVPWIGVQLPPLVSAVLGLALNYSAYESEIYRAGLKAVPLGQFEAALALGMSRLQALRHVVVPQAARIALPPVTSDFIALFKDTSVCSVITVMELTKRYNILSLTTGRFFELAAVTAILYLVMSWPLALWVRRLERRLEPPGTGPAG